MYLYKRHSFKGLNRILSEWEPVAVAAVKELIWVWFHPLRTSSAAGLNPVVDYSFLPIFGNTRWNLCCQNQLKSELFLAFTHFLAYVINMYCSQVIKRSLRWRSLNVLKNSINFVLFFFKTDKSKQTFLYTGFPEFSRGNLKSFNSILIQGFGGILTHFHLIVYLFLRKDI